MKKTICIVLSFIMICVGSVFCVSAERGSDDISPAIEFLRSHTTFTKCSVIGETVYFAKDEYETTVGTDFSYITITALPDPAKGALKLNGVPVASGQTIASASINYLVFVPLTDDEGNVSFGYRCSASGWESTDITCNMLFSEKKNMPPVLGSGEIVTYENVNTEKVIDVFEPDGDEYTFVIDEYPTSGRIVFGKENTFVYYPTNGFYGDDVLSLHAVDKYGNSSGTKTISISVEKSQNNLVFDDMNASPVHAQAISLAENSVVTYVYSDGKYFYEPTTEVSRIDFLVMLMAAEDIDVSNTSVDLTFDDVSNLSTGKKQYLSEAVSKGIVKTEKSFRPDDIIMESEAMEWISVFTEEKQSALSVDSKLNREEVARLLGRILK